MRKVNMPIKDAVEAIDLVVVAQDRRIRELERAVSDLKSLLTGHMEITNSSLITIGQTEEMIGLCFDSLEARVAHLEGDDR